MPVAGLALALRARRSLRTLERGDSFALWMKRVAKVSLVAGISLALTIAFILLSRATFPKETVPEGAYARITVAITSGHPRDCFPYLETQAQWAAYTIRDYRSKAAARIARDYPDPDKSAMLATYRGEAEAADGADVWLALAESRGWIKRLRKDLSGVQRVEMSGERATIETARGTRYAFRRRDNGIWGLTTFTAELVAEAEKAARDFEMVQRAADDYERAAEAAGAP
jgi:hypothetical protein